MKQRLWRCPLCVHGNGGVVIGLCGFHSHQSYLAAGLDPDAPWLGPVSKWTKKDLEHAKNTRGPEMRPCPYPEPPEWKP